MSDEMHKIVRAAEKLVIQRDDRENELDLARTALEKMRVNYDGIAAECVALAAQNKELHRQLAVATDERDEAVAVVVKMRRYVADRLAVLDEAKTRLGANEIVAKLIVGERRNELAALEIELDATVPPELRRDEKPTDRAINSPGGGSPISDTERMNWIEAHHASSWPYTKRFHFSSLVESDDPFTKHPTVREAVDAAIMANQPVECTALPRRHSRRCSAEGGS